MENSQLPLALQAQPLAAIGKAHRALAWISHYIKQHEILIIVLLAAILVFGVTGKVEDIIAKHDARVYSKKEAALEQQKAANAQQAQANALIAQNNAQLAAEYKQFATDALAQNAKLVQQNAALNNKLHEQQSADATLQPSDLAARIVTLANLRKDSIIPKTDKTFSVAPDAAVGIAQSLENVPVLQTQLANVQAEKANDDKVIAKHDGIVAGLGQQIGGLNTLIAGKDAELKKKDDACKAEIKVAVDKERKGKAKWFAAGYIAGLLTKPVAKLLGL